MNRLLIGILDIINKLVALLLVLSSTVSGYYGRFDAFIPPLGNDVLGHVISAVIGFIAGLVLAGLFSGFVAAIITIARETTLTREILLSRPTAVVTPPYPPAS